MLIQLAHCWPTGACYLGCLPYLPVLRFFNRNEGCLLYIYGLPRLHIKPAMIARMDGEETLIREDSSVLERGVGLGVGAEA